MITHIVGTDTNIDIVWTDDLDVAIVPTSISFIVKDRDGTQVWARTPSELVISIPASEVIAGGNYFYKFSAVADGLTTMLSAGLLRVREL